MFSEKWYFRANWKCLFWGRRVSKRSFETEQTNILDSACAWNNQPGSCIHHSLTLTVLVREWIFRILCWRGLALFILCPLIGDAVVDLSETLGWSSAYAFRCWCLSAKTAVIITATFSVLNGPDHWPKTIVCVYILKGSLEVILEINRSCWETALRLKVFWWQGWLKGVDFDLPLDQPSCILTFFRGLYSDIYYKIRNNFEMIPRIQFQVLIAHKLFISFCALIFSQKNAREYVLSVDCPSLLNSSRGLMRLTNVR